MSGEERDNSVPDEDEFHARADALERVFGIGESIAVDEACATLRAAAQWVHAAAARHVQHVYDEKGEPT